MPDPFRLGVKFWGVRGSTPTPEIDNMGYGGNTTCVEIQGPKGEQLIVDAGTGIRKLGVQLAEQKQPPQTVDLFLTHFHWDHIQGIPFFIPLLREGNLVRFHSFLPNAQIQERLASQMRDPFFTLAFDRLAACREFLQFNGGSKVGDLSVTNFPLHHPQGACGYRIESDGAVVVIATDLEHGDAVLDKKLREYSEGADILIYDAQYTPAEYESRKGWGHSTYRAAAKVAHDAHVKKLVLFHHDPLHTDQQMNSIVDSAAREFENTIAAREHESITL